ncbi:MAG: hypothetical protein HF312_15620 [Ignavibacteria bacterium]|nr:hypothetical protein [Ignavibacteria bacterium]
MKINDIITMRKKYGRPAFCWSKQCKESGFTALNIDWMVDEAVVLRYDYGQFPEPEVIIGDQCEIMLPEMIDADALVRWLEDEQVQHLMNCIQSTYEIMANHDFDCSTDILFQAQIRRLRESFDRDVKLFLLPDGGYMDAVEYFYPIRYEIGIDGNYERRQLEEVAWHHAQLAAKRNIIFSLPGAVEYLTSIRNEYSDAKNRA